MLTRIILDDSPRAPAFFEALELSEKYPSFFLGCKTRYVRRITERKNIPEESYTFAKKIDDKWLPSTADYCRAKLLLREDWARDNIPHLTEDIEGEKEVENKLFEEEKHPLCPPVIALEETDMFRDNQGNLFKVKMVGERAEDKCFFKVGDVAAAFDIPYLNKSLTNKDRGYERGRDYVCFSGCASINTNGKATKLELYLTLTGLMRVLYCSRVGLADQYRKWCTSVLFKATFGNREEKIDLSAELLSIPSQSLKALLSKSATDMPVIYLFKLSGARRKDVPPIFYKFGCTANFKRRADELCRKFKELKLDSELEMFAYIDPKYIFEAETFIKTSLMAVGERVTIDGLKEVEYLSFDAARQKFVRDQFYAAAQTYAGRAADVQAKITALENRIKMVELENELMKEKHAREMAEVRLELREKDIEIMKLKM